MKNIFLIALFFSTAYLQAQTGSLFNYTGSSGLSTVYATDYQAIGINPANIPGDTAHAMALSIGETAFSFFSEALIKDDVRDIIFNNDDALDSAEQQTLALAFLNNGVTFDVDVRTIGLSFKATDAIGIALSFDGSSQYFSKFSESAASLIFEGYDFDEYIDTIIVTPDDTFGVAYEPLSLSELMNGTALRFNVRSDINLAVGARLINQNDLIIYGGVGLKYIMGYAYFDLKAEGDQTIGVSSLGLGIFELDENDTPSEIVNEVYKPVGKGFGVDLGVSAKLGEKISLGLSIIDIGKMKYQANVLQLNNVVLDTIRFSGVTTDNPVQLIQQILEDNNVLEYSGLTEIGVALPTTLRIGAGYQATNFLRIGADAAVPFNNVAGAYENALVGIGGEITLAKVIKLSAGASFGGGYNTNISGGFVLDFKIWELGIATRDIKTLFGQESPTVSMAIGVLRFKI
ncbi:MAG: hypothetical protein H7Y00_09590 [Fimbriimonadaceae bacterium]|nr:hypothetical protein [Chitinophagales bacterium]